MASFQRWYDADPALSKALAQLRSAEDRYQAQVALNIIKIVLEHQAEEDGETCVEDLALPVDGSEATTRKQLRRRWYDVNETLRSAMQLLQDCPDELQKSVIPTICRMIEDTLNQPLTSAE